MTDLDWQVIPAEDKPKCKKLAQIENKTLPSLPATIVCLGSCGSGKSSLIFTLLTQGFVYGKKKKSVFDEACVFLGTLDAEDAFRKLPIKNLEVFHEYDPGLFEAYLDDLKVHQMERLKAGKAMRNNVLILDDFVGAGLMKKPRPNVPPPIEKLALTSRHESNMSIIFCSQVYKNSGFSAPSIRNNVTTWIVCRMSAPEARKLAEEHAEMYEVDEWLEHYWKIMASEKFTFVVLDKRRPITEDRWTIRFNKPFPPSRRWLAMQAAKEKAD